MKYAALIAGLYVPWAIAVTPDEMVKKADRFRMPSGNVMYNARVIEYDGNSKLRETRYSVAFGVPESLRIETKFPERSSGRNFLMIGNDLWLQTPDLERPTRISFQQKLTGEVSNGDVARTAFATDYTAELVGEETVNGKKTKKLLLTAKAKDVTYAAIYYWIESKTFQPVKAEFLTSEMKVLKRGLFKTPKKVMNQIVLTELDLTDGINVKRRSVLSYSDFKRVKFKESTFNKESLKSHGI